MKYKYNGYAIQDAQGRLWSDRWRDPFSYTKNPKVWSRRYDAEWRLKTLMRAAQYSWSQDLYKDALPLSIVTVEIGVTQ